MLAERLDELPDEVRKSAPAVVPAVAPYDLDDNGPLEQPIEEEFRAGTMTLAWDPDEDKVVLEVFPINETEIIAEVDESGALVDEDAVAAIELDEPEPDEVLLVRIAPRNARRHRAQGRAPVNIRTLEPEAGAATLRLNEIGLVSLRATVPLAFDPYARNRYSGGFILVDEATHATVAAGMIAEPARPPPRPDLEPEYG